MRLWYASACHVLRVHDAREGGEHPAGERAAHEGLQVTVRVEERVLELRGARAVVDEDLASAIGLRQDLDVGEVV
jgi:hypothetical protein